MEWDKTYTAKLVRYSLIVLTVRTILVGPYLQDGTAVVDRCAEIVQCAAVFQENVRIEDIIDIPVQIFRC